MTKTEMHAVLADHLARYRSLSYKELAARVERGPFWKPRDCLEHIEGTAPDGTQYHIELNAFWNDRPNEEVRVDGSLSAEPQRPLWGFIPLYTADVTDSFTIAPDGRLLFEHDTNVA
jgi:hypothetical protein